MKHYQLQCPEFLSSNLRYDYQQSQSMVEYIELHPKRLCQLYQDPLSLYVI